MTSAAVPIEYHWFRLIAPLVNGPMIVGSAVGEATLTGIPVVVATAEESPMYDADAPCHALNCMARMGRVVNRVAPAPNVTVNNAINHLTEESTTPAGVSRNQTHPAAVVRG